VPADTTTSASRAAVEAAVLDLTDEQIVRALVKEDAELKRSFADRESETWHREAALNVLRTLARRLESGRVKPKG
jgi:hypothetical protein